MCCRSVASLHFCIFYFDPISRKQFKIHILCLSWRISPSSSSGLMLYPSSSTSGEFYKRNTYVSLKQQTVQIKWLLSKYDFVFREWDTVWTYISVPVNLPIEAVWSPIGPFLWLSKWEENFSNFRLCDIHIRWRFVLFEGVTRGIYKCLVEIWV